MTPTMTSFRREKENEEEEEVEAEDFTDEISSDDDEDLDDLVEEECTVATRILRTGKKRMPLSHSDHGTISTRNRRKKFILGIYPGS